MARKLLRGSCLFPVHMRDTMCWLLFWISNLRLCGNSLSEGPRGKGEGCVVYLCAVVGMEEGGWENMGRSY